MAVNRIFGRDPGQLAKAGFNQAPNNQSLYWTVAQNQGVPNWEQLFDPGDPQVSCCAGPDEAIYYVIAYDDPSGRIPTSQGGGIPSATYATSYIGFRGSLKSAGTAALFQLVADVTGAPLPPSIDQARTEVTNAGMYPSW